MYSTSVSLLERLRQPAQPEAWGRFVELYTPLLYYWARRLGLQSHDAADLVQDVFAVLIERMPEFAYDPHKSFRNWLRTITLNKWREYQRRTLPTQELRVTELSELAGPDNAEALWESEHRRQLLGRALVVMQTDFQPATWKAFWEYVVRGRPAAEVAAELGITVGALHAAKFRVVGRLRQELKGMMD